MSVVLLSACRDRNVQVSYKSALSKGSSTLIKFLFYWKFSYLTKHSWVLQFLSFFFIEYWYFHRKKKNYMVLLYKGFFSKLNLKTPRGTKPNQHFQPLQRNKPNPSSKFLQMAKPNPSKELSLTQTNINSRYGSRYYVTKLARSSKYVLESLSESKKEDSFIVYPLHMVVSTLYSMDF